MAKAYLFPLLERDQEGQELAVLVEQADNTVYAYPLEDGISLKRGSFRS